MSSRFLFTIIFSQNHSQGMNLIIMSRTGKNIYKRKDGRWEARYIKCYDENGKAKYGYIYAKSYGEARKKQINAISQTTFTNKNNNSTLYSKWLDEWLIYIKPHVKESTFIRYKNIVFNHLKPTIGKLTLSKINTGYIKSYISILLSDGRLDSNGGLSPKTVSDIAMIVKASLKYIVSCGETIDCNYEDLRIKNNSQKKMQVLTKEEEQKLVDALMKNKTLTKIGILLSLYTGIRIGELCALQWEDISFEENLIIIRKTMQRLQKDNIQSENDSKTFILISKPKSQCSNRQIPLPSFLSAILKEYRGKKDSFILTNTSASFIEPRTMQNHFKRILEQIDLRDFNYHSLRHTFATRCVEAGFDIKSLSEILGHSSVKITLDKYVHSSMEQKRLNMEKLQQSIINHSTSNL